MRLLVLGGTIFLGRHIVQAALERGHEVTMFNRGRSNTDLFPEVEKIHGNRDGELAKLAGRNWDAVIDTCGYVPRVVKASAEFLQEAAEHYTFISSVSVYKELKDKGVDETYPVATIEDETIEQVTGQTYGALKALCEKTLGATLPGKALIIRPGLIAGPNDPTDRLTYWPVRTAKGGEMLAPGNPAHPLQFIDVRDLAEWTVRLVEQKQTGVYNATGPDYTLEFGKYLETCREITNSDARFTWAATEFLLKNVENPWIELPDWAPPEHPELGGLSFVNIQKAVESGLTFRSLAVTIKDTLEWHKTVPADAPFRAGLKPEREQELLQLWHQQKDN